MIFDATSGGQQELDGATYSDVGSTPTHALLRTVPVRLYYTFTASLFSSLPKTIFICEANLPIWPWRGIFVIHKCNPPCAATDPSSSVRLRAPSSPYKLLIFSQTAPPSTPSVILRISSKFTVLRVVFCE